MVNIEKLMAYENDELEDDEIIELFQSLINDGTVWKLQGSYGRTAVGLIDAGLCTHSSNERKSL